MDARNKINQLNRGRINPTAWVRVGSGNAEAVCEKEAVRSAANAAAEAVFRVFTQSCSLEKKRSLKVG